MWSVANGFSFIEFTEKMEKEGIPKNQEKKVEELHWEIQEWKSQLQFMDDELVFIDRLLDSYVFQPDTPNLFERLQNYKTRLQKVKAHKREVRGHISKHENTLGGMLECTDSACDHVYYHKHDELQTQVGRTIAGFHELKSQIFDYAGGILKKRKP